MREDRISKFQRLFGLTSLRGRFRFAALALTLVVVSAAWITDRYVVASGQAVSQTFGGRNEAVELSRLVRSQVWEAEFALQTYLLDTSREAEEAFHVHLTQAIQQAQRFAAAPWIIAGGLQERSQRLVATLNDVHAAAKRLLAVRTDPEELFPVVKVMRSTLEPASIAFNSAVTLAHDETLGEPEQREGYRLLDELRHTWTSMIAGFRIYVMSRTGGFGGPESKYRDQLRDVTLFYDEVQRLLQRLDELNKRGRLPFQAAGSLAELQANAVAWHNGFEQAVAIDRDHLWRSDAPLMRDAIQPLFAAIRASLLELDKAMATACSKPLCQATALA